MPDLSFPLANGPYLAGTLLTKPLAYNSIALLGDSRNDQATSGGAIGNGLTRTRTATHWLNWFNALNNQPLALVAKYALSGTLTSALDGQITSLLAVSPRPQFAAIWSGVNDLAAAVTAAAAFTNIQNACTRLLSYGITPIVFLEPGSTTFTTSALMVQLFALNERLRSFSEVNRGVLVFDTTTTIWDSTGAAWTATPAPVFKTGYSIDGTHLNNLGGYNLGVAFGTWFSNVVRSVDAQPATIGEFIFANNPLTAVLNGLFNTTSGGATSGSGTLSSGTVPANWTLNLGAASSTSTLSTASGTAGNVLTNVITVPGATTLKLSQDAPSAAKSAAAIGDYFQAEWTLTVSAGTNLQGINIIHEYNDGTNTFTFYDMYCQSSAANGPQAYGPIQCTPFAMQLTTTPSGWITTRIEIVFSGAGGATVAMSRVRNRKRLFS